MSKLVAVPPPAESARNPRPRRSLPAMVPRAMQYVVLLAGLVIMLAPFAYMVGISFTPNTYVLPMPPTFVPTHPTLDNYAAAWNGNSFGHAFLNSLEVAVSSTVLGVGLSAALAFAFARYKFPGRAIMFYGMLSTLMVPSIVLIIPQFVLASHLHILNSKFGLILVYAATNGTAFSVYLLRNAFQGLPQEMMDAAAIDGCGVWRTFLQIGLPLVRPALSAATIFAFLGNWDEFTWALTSLTDPSLFTLPIAIQQYYSDHLTQWGIVFAASSIAVVPVILVFLIFQRYFIQGISAGAIKG
jgi:multiple sugar transport system permease protein